MKLCAVQVLDFSNVQDRIERIATDIFHELKGRPMATLCVLKGGYKFYSDLLVIRCVQ